MNKELEALNILRDNHIQFTKEKYGKLDKEKLENIINLKLARWDILEEAIKRNEPMKVNSISTHDEIGLQYGICSNCESMTKRHYRKGKTISLVDGLFCSTCGQRLGWSDEK